MTKEDDKPHTLAAAGAGERIEAPELPYLPQRPKSYAPKIALVACGSITGDHLAAYRTAGYDVAALCDVNLEQAEKRQKEFYPGADLYEDYRDVLRRDDIEVVDLAAHPPVRAPMIEDSLRAGKHVLSQKPFVLDLDVGRRMVDLADKMGVRLAVNKNGRWAPHFSYAREAITAGLLGDVMAAHLSVHWDHTWVKGTEFEKIKHLILYDFAIHWFDIVTCFFGEKQAQRVYASTARSPGQEVESPLLAQAVIEYDDAQASLAFDADTRFGTLDRTFVTGSDGTIISTGPDLEDQTLTLYTSEGHAVPQLEGTWFPGAFRGTMGELLSAIEEDREPTISGRNNLRSLELSFAAIAGAERHEPVTPGTVQKMP